jgi:hypothetical protein
MKIFSRFILLSATCVKKKLTRDYRVKLQPGYFQKYRFFSYLYMGDKSKTPHFFRPLRYMYGYAFIVFFSFFLLAACTRGMRWSWLIRQVWVSRPWQLPDDIWVPQESDKPQPRLTRSRYYPAPCFPFRKLLKMCVDPQLHPAQIIAI